MSSKDHIVFVVDDDFRMREALHELAAEMDEADNAQLEEPSAEILEEYQRLLGSLGDSERQPAAV